MTDPAQQLAQDRDRRKRARGAFDANLAQVKDDLAARGVAGRIADQAEAEVRGAIAQGVDVARESKGIIAATVAALALWFLRVPLIAWIRKLTGKTEDPSTVQE